MPLRRNCWQHVPFPDPDCALCKGEEWTQETWPPGEQKYDRSEQDIVLAVFATMLREPTKDGGNKRARGEKEPWWRDPEHEQRAQNHINRWNEGERKDRDSGVHPLIHAAWRMLAIAYQESYGKVDPVDGPFFKT